MVLTLVKNEWQAVIAVVLLSVSVCLNGFIQPLLAAEIFGRSAYNTTLGHHDGHAVGRRGCCLRRW